MKEDEKTNKFELSRLSPENKSAVLPVYCSMKFDQFFAELVLTGNRAETRHSQ